MSTTFGILIRGDPFELVDGDIPEEYIRNEDWIDDFEVVAFRFNDGGIFWRNALSEFLPDETKVYPLDNTTQGIFTIGDIKKEIQYYENSTSASITGYN